jgi:hypothetical protein
MKRDLIETMIKPSVLCTIFICLFGLCLLSPETSSSQLIDRISSEHIVMRMPIARESLGRDTIEEIEQCYSFMNRAIGGSLPRRILIDVNWDQPDSGCNQRDTSITIGMDRPDKTVNLNSLLLHKVGREIARLGLLELSGWAQREDTEFLFEGMIEILMHEFDHSSRSLESAWTYCQILDQMQLLGFNTQRSWSVFSAGKRLHRNAAPGVAFFTTFRELQGREHPLKLFETLKKASLTASLANTFKAPIAELEGTWLKKVREHRPVDEITIVAEDAPQLLQAEAIPESGQSGIQIRLLLSDRNGDLFPDGVFVKDDRTQRALQAQASPEKATEYMVVRIPIEANCPPGQYGYGITAIDEAGNLRRWTRSYTVGSR